MILSPEVFFSGSYARMQSMDEYLLHVYESSH